MSEKNFNTKNCSTCKKTISITEFYNNKRSADGFGYRCKTCSKIAKDSYRITREGVVADIYSNQKQNSKQRGHKSPEYSLKCFREWCFNHPDFEILFINWTNSGHDKWEKPSIDRVDDYKGYSFDNLLRIVTWKENSDRGNADRVNGINNKQSKKVIQLTRDGIIINEYYSQHNASRATGISQGHISNVCRGEKNQSGEFVWCFACN